MRAHPSQGQVRARIVVELEPELPFEIAWGSQRGAVGPGAGPSIDGSKFKAMNNRDRNFTRAKVERRWAQLEESVARYLSQLDMADRQEPSETLAHHERGSWPMSIASGRRAIRATAFCQD